jgi:hypothetical protein
MFVGLGEPLLVSLNTERGYRACVFGGYVFFAFWS